MEILFSILTLIGMGYAAFVGIKWMLKAGKVSHNKEMPLSPTDLKVLEDSAARMMSDLQAAADECVSRIELALAEAEHRIAAMQTISVPTPCPTSPIESASLTFAPNSCDIIDSNESAVDAARQFGLTTGEVELLRGLRSISPSI